MPEAARKYGSATVDLIGETARVSCSDTETYGLAARVTAYCKMSDFLRSGGQTSGWRPADELRYYVNDFLFAAPSRTADSFGVLGRHYSRYVEALDAAGVRLRWAHFLWALHVYDALGVADGVRAGPRVDVDVTLMRGAATIRNCPTNVSFAPLLRAARVDGFEGGEAAVRAGAAAGSNLQARLCPTPGELQCGWKTIRCSVDAAIGPANEQPMAWGAGGAPALAG
jgi:hypothetical protein